MFNTNEDLDDLDSYDWDEEEDATSTAFEDYDELDYALLKLESLRKKVNNSKLIGRKDLEGLEMFFPNVISLEDFTIEPTESNLRLMQSFESVGVITLIVGAIIAAITAIISFVLGRNTKTSEDFDKNQETAAVSATKVINIKHSPQSTAHSSNGTKETPTANVVPVNDITPDSTPKEVIMSMAANTPAMDKIAERSNFLTDKIGINTRLKRTLVLSPDHFNVFYELSTTINYEMIKKINQNFNHVGELLHTVFRFDEAYNGENDIKMISGLISELNSAVKSEINKIKNAYKEEINIEGEDADSMYFFKTALRNFISYYSIDVNRNVNPFTWTKLLELTEVKKYGYYRSIKKNTHILYFIKNKNSITKEFEAFKKVVEKTDAIKREYVKAISIPPNQKELLKITDLYQKTVLDYIYIYKTYYAFVIDTANMMDDVVSKVHSSCEHLINYHHQMIKKVSTESFKNLPLSSKW
jgi:hypothetical protein